MKKTALFIAGLIFLSIAVSHAYDTVHVFISGTVNSVNSDTMTIDNDQYVIDEKCRVIIVYNENDSWHEKPSRASDIRTGDKVTVKKIANTLYEIRIGR